jgi:hypothetical protein
MFRGGGMSSHNFVLYEDSASANGGGIPAVTVSSEVGLSAGGSIALTPGEATLIQLYIGDSISSNSGASAYVPTNTKNEMHNPHTGSLWRYKDPHVGVSTGPGSYPGRVADKLIDASEFTRMITMNTSIGGAASSDYAKSGPFNHRVRVALMWARSFGWPVAAPISTWRFAVIYACGTNDNALGISQAAFEANALSCFDTIRDFGCNAPIFINKCSLLANDGDVDTGIQAAQDALINNGLGRYAGFNMDSLTTTTNRQSGNYPHLTNTGNDALATGIKDILAAHF